MTKKTKNDIKIDKAEALITSMTDVDNSDLQEPLGRAVAKLNHYAGRLTAYCQSLL